MIGALIGGAAFAFSSAGSALIFPYLIGSAGLLLVHERLRIEFDPSVALVATLLVFAGTSMYWSMTRVGWLADLMAFGIVASVTLLQARTGPPRIPRAAAWGILAMLPLALRFIEYFAGRIGTTAPASSVAALFSSSHGFLSLTPIAYLALVGTIVYFRKNPVWAAGAIAVMGIWMLAGAATSMSPTPDVRFGHRLTPALAILSPGLAFVIDRARARPWLAVAPLVVTAVAWNYWLMVQYTVGMLPKDAPVSFGSMVRQQADVHTRSPYVYPFAFPANVWFAWREGIPAERYELLANEPRLPTIDLTLDRRALRYVLEGWQAPGPDDVAPLQWIRERRATLAVPLEIPTGRDVNVFVTARARLEEPAVRANLGLEINGHEIGRFVVPATAPLEVPFKVPAAEVGRVWRAGYNRVTFVSYGVERADPSDQRPPGPLGSRTGDRAWPVAIYRIRIQPS